MPLGRLALGEDRVEAIVVIGRQVAGRELEERIGGAVGGRQRVAEEMIAPGEQALEDLDPSRDACAERLDALAIGSGASSRPLIVFGGSFPTSFKHSRKT